MLNSRCILKIRPFEESGSYRWLVFFFFSFSVPFSQIADNVDHEHSRNLYY